MNAFYYLSLGIVLGLGAGISPGPLFTLVITETLKHDKREGFKIGCVPLLTDFPIIFVSIFLLSKVSNSEIIFGILSILGGLFLLYLGYENITINKIEVNQSAEQPHSLRKGLITNYLNPHPYLFWGTIGSPTMIKAWQMSHLYPVYFAFGFFLMLVGSKFVIVIITDKSKTILSSRYYLSIVRGLGIVLLVLAVILFKDGLSFLGIPKP